jgi:carboxymethylenebutenolidase
MAGPWPPGTERQLISRTEGQGRVVEEAIATYEHEGTGRTIRLPHVLARDEDGERYYFDEATVLVQAGLLDDRDLPVCGVEQAEKALDPRGLPTNTLMGRWAVSVDDEPLPYEASPPLGDPQTVLDEHLAAEFAHHDIVKTMRTMAPDPYLNHVPVMTGGVGWNEVHRFYKHHFIPGWPADTASESVARTVGDGMVIDELVVRYTHDREMDAIIPGIKPTGRPVELPHAVVVGFQDGRVAFEHIYWDNASALRQIGVLDAA